MPYARERFFKGSDFDDFIHVRAAAPKWCLEVAGMRIHGTTHKQPLVIFQDEERHTLLPWDGVPYEIKRANAGRAPSQSTDAPEHPQHPSTDAW